eukprot:8392242-Lingulodinium_polyedra.AAC.1
MQMKRNRANNGFNAINANNATNATWLFLVPARPHACVDKCCFRAALASCLSAALALLGCCFGAAA